MPDVTDWRKRQQAAWTTLRTARSPQQGIYYWLPRRKGGWRLLIWLASTNNPNDLNHLSHLHVWAEVVEHLSHEWRLDIEHVRAILVGRFASIARGRVGITYDGYWVIGMGTRPGMAVKIQRLCRIFWLHAHDVRVMHHDHWDPLPEDQQAMENLLKDHR